MPGRFNLIRVLTPAAVVAAASIAMVAPSEAGARYVCDNKRATIVGTQGPDRIVGTPGRDVIVARGGNDRIYGLGGNDVICAGGSNGGGSAGDKVWGGPGNDLIVVNAGTAYGGRGNDEIIGGGTVYGGTGDDSFDGADRAYGGQGNDDFGNIEDGYGGPGDDSFGAPLWDSYFEGGPGTDEVYFYFETDDEDPAVVVDLATGLATRHEMSETGRPEPTDNVTRFIEVENVWGTWGDDVIYGDDGPNVLRGSGGNDVIDGRGGHDVVYGGEGTDSCTGEVLQGCE